MWAALANNIVTCTGRAAITAFLIQTPCSTKGSDEIQRSVVETSYERLYLEEEVEQRWMAEYPEGLDGGQMKEISIPVDPGLAEDDNRA